MSVNAILTGKQVSIYPNRPITSQAYSQLTPAEKAADVVYVVSGDSTNPDLVTHTELATKADKGSSFTVILTSSGWSNGQQTVSNSAFVAVGYSYLISPEASGFNEYLNAQIYAEDVGVDGSMVFHCAANPSSNIQVNVLKVQVV